jgi:3-phosphoshikimate 1-carboxyvinyltransferase
MKQLYLPRSKSLVIRYQILSFLYEGRILEVLEEDAEDVKVVYRALRTIKAHEGNEGEPIAIDVQDCGAGYRFLMAVLAITPGAWLLTGTKRLIDRPIFPLVNALREMGAELSEAPNGWLIRGKVLPNAFSVAVDCSSSSQFISALFMISQKVGGINIQPIPKHFSSQSYYELTQQVWGSYFLEGVPSQIEGDWSGAVYGYAYAMLQPGEKVVLHGLQYPSIQHDAQIVPLFEKWGVQTQVFNDRVELFFANSAEIPPQEINLENNLDLAPVLAILALLYPFQLTLTRIKNLDHKESKRATHLVELLQQFTRVTTTTESGSNSIDTLTIEKREHNLPSFLHLDAHQDHRLIMAFELFSLFTQVEITNKEHVKKSFPLFYK